MMNGGRLESYYQSVSIQLVSPASGDNPGQPTQQNPGRNPRNRFHSIGFPSEWGHFIRLAIESAESEEFPFNWFPQRVGTLGGGSWASS
jgi:hypothetical protein